MQTVTNEYKMYFGAIDNSPSNTIRTTALNLTEFFGLNFTTDKKIYENIRLHLFLGKF